MALIEPDELQPVENPELVFAFVAPVGTPLNVVCRSLERALESRDYTVRTISLSEQLAGLHLQSPSPPDDAAKYVRISALMDRGNELRRVCGGGEALALLAASRINEGRPEREEDAPPPYLSGYSFILRQLKHPDEATWLRRVYGDAFHLIGIYCPEDYRRSYLITDMTEAEADELIQRDEGEDASYGQQLRDTYYRSDVFITLESAEDEGRAKMEEELERYIYLVFGDMSEGIITPTVDEFGMHLASMAALRSADLSRQVGAAILTRCHEVVSIGCNEVPKHGGGQYWTGDVSMRDFEVDDGYDSNAQMRIRIINEILETIERSFEGLEVDDREQLVEEISQRLSGTRVADLTEFGRAVHAEMEAILAAARVGVSTVGCDLYTTTFPCHNCAKHVVASGVSRVVYVEPYPKSLALELHGDAMEFEENDAADKVKLKSFVGVAPRRYSKLFSIRSEDGRRLKRKNADGTFNREILGLRLFGVSMTYLDREVLAALAAQKIGELTTAQEDGE